MAQWFEVDRKGLAQIVARRGKRFILYELLQNAWDEASKGVAVRVSSSNRHSYGLIEVQDDSPEGFADLTHAYTLFAESRKKHDPERRGRFNIGEKLVIAACKEASIITTKGTVDFLSNGQRTHSKVKTDKGSIFHGVLRLTADEAEDLALAASQVIPPVQTTYNGKCLEAPKCLAQFDVTLPTELADAEGNLRRAARKTTVKIYEPRAGETPMLYELGIPVVETDDRWHYEVMQKVPLNMERDNVPASYLRTLRVHVANTMFEYLQQDDANATWAREALADERCDPATVHKLTQLRFGDKAVVYDLHDKEANSLAVAQGYTLVTGSMLNADEWESVRRAEALDRAGVVTPSPKPFSPDGKPLRLIDKKEWSPAMQRFNLFAMEVSKDLLGKACTLRIANEVAWPFAGAFGPEGVLYVNAARLGKAWFEKLASEDMNRFLIHEFGHGIESNHLSDRYHDALCRLGARFVTLALRRPTIFK